MKTSAAKYSARDMAGASSAPRRVLTALAFSGVVGAATALASFPVEADSVTAAAPHTAHRAALSDNHRDGRPSQVPQRLDIHVVPQLEQPREESRARSSGGGSICQGSDGGTTISTASRHCDPSAPAGDGGANAGTSTGSISTSRDAS